MSVFTIVGVVLFIGFLRWFGQRVESLTAEAKKSGAGNDSEEERMRKLLAALGLPQAEVLKPSSQRETLRPPAPPSSARPGQARPIPPFQGEGMPAIPGLHRRKREVSATVPPRIQAATVENPHLTQLDLAPRSESQRPSLELPEEATYGTSEQTASSTAYAAPGTGFERSAALRALLSTPESLRSAFLLREILDGPRSLQRAGGIHILPLP